MITRDQLDNWIKAEHIVTRPIEQGVEFDPSNPWDEIHDETGSLRLIDGTLHVNWVDGGWNGYGEEQFTDLRQFANRWETVMEFGLTG